LRLAAKKPPEGCAARGRFNGEEVNGKPGTRGLFGSIWGEENAKKSTNEGMEIEGNVKGLDAISSTLFPRQIKRKGRRCRRKGQLLTLAKMRKRRGSWGIKHRRKE